MNLPHHLQQSLEEVHYTHLVLAYSGGIDSQVLLHLLSQLIRLGKVAQVSAVHVNHGLSKQADNWQRFCEQQCRERNIPLTTLKVAIAHDDPQGPEAAARSARYAAIIRHCQADSLVLTAHHANDQLETLLLNLKRGSGPKGLAGIARHRELAPGISVYRPMLSVTREQIELYATENNLRWQEDDSNQDLRYDRNFLRQQVMPLLLCRWPSILDTAGRSAQLCKEQQILLEQEAANRLTDLLDDNNAMCIPALLTHSHAWQKELLRYWLTAKGDRAPSAKQIEQILRAAAAKEDANPRIKFGDAEVRRFRQHLYQVTPHPAPSPAQLSVESPSRVKLPAVILHVEPLSARGGSEAYADRRLDETELTLHHPHLTIDYGNLSQRFKPPGEQLSKPLKQWLKAWAMPPWVRQQVPLLYDGDRFIGIVCDHRIMLCQKRISSEDAHYQVQLTLLSP